MPRRTQGENVQPGNRDPAEGSRKVIDRELERQEKNGETPPPGGSPGSDADERPEKPVG